VGEVSALEILSRYNTVFHLDYSKNYQDNKLYC